MNFERLYKVEASKRTPSAAKLITSTRMPFGVNCNSECPNIRGEKKVSKDRIIDTVR